MGRGMARSDLGAHGRPLLTAPRRTDYIYDMVFILFKFSSK